MNSVLCKADGRIGRITLNRPESLNAITRELALELTRSLRWLEPQVNVIVLRGAGEAFCAGGDVVEVGRHRAAGRAELASLFEAVREAITTIRQVAVPVVAVVHGDAVAGGFEIIEAVDIAVVATTARLADRHARFGQVPGGGGSQMLPRLVGTARALGLVLTGDFISGEEAERIGLAYRAVEPEQLDARAEQLLEMLAGRSRDAQAAIKRLVRLADETNLEHGLDAEHDAVVGHLMGPAGEAALRAFADRANAQ